MIDELLSSKLHACYSKEDIRTYARSKGVEWVEYGPGSVKDSVDHTIDEARREVDKCLRSFGLKMVRVKKNGSTYLYGYPDEVFEQNIDVIKKHREKTRNLRKAHIDEIISHSKGLLPDSILANVLVEKKDEKPSIIEFDSQMLENIELLSNLYFAVRDKQVIAFDYCAYGEDKVQVILHPHYIREYNNRWYVYGYAIQNRGVFPVNNYPVDRILSATLQVKTEEAFVEPQVDYNSYFKDFVGANKPKNERIVEIILRTNHPKIHGLISTKKLHPSQKTIQTWNDISGNGRVMLKAIPSIELRARILSFGKGLTVEKPAWLAEKYRREIQEMLDLYQLPDSGNSLTEE